MKEHSCAKSTHPSLLVQCHVLVSRGQTLFHTEGKVWGMAIEQLVAPHRGVRTNHSTVFSHMIAEVYMINGKIQNFSLNRVRT